MIFLELLPSVIKFPAKALLNDEVRDALMGEEDFGKSLVVDGEIARISVQDAPDGQFGLLEDALMENGFAFDRLTSEGDGIPEEIRCFRPATSEHPAMEFTWSDGEEIWEPGEDGEDATRSDEVTEPEYGVNSPTGEELDPEIVARVNEAAKNDGWGFAKLFPITNYL